MRISSRAAARLAGASAASSLLLFAAAAPSLAATSATPTPTSTGTSAALPTHAIDDAPISAVFVKATHGYSGLFDGTSQLLFTVDDGHGTTTDVLALCVQEKIDLNPDRSVKYLPEPWASLGIDRDRVAKAADVAANHENIGTPASTSAAEGAATQLAAWSLTSDFDYSSQASTLPSMFARADELVASASADVAEPTNSYVLEATVTQSGAGAAAADTVGVWLRDRAGAPVADETVAIAVAGSSKPVNVTTDEDGKASTTIDAPAAAGEASVSWAGDLQPGVVFGPTVGQRVVTGEAAKVTRTVEVALPAQKAAPATSSTPSPSKSRHDTPTGPHKPSMPYTGPEAGGALTLTLAGLGAAVAGFLLYRRRTNG